MSLDCLKKYNGNTIVIKYGGSIMKSHVSQKAFFEDIAMLKKEGINIVIIHGGGPNISELLEKLGIESRFIRGLRVTDEKAMEVVEMALSGQVNKDLSGKLSVLGINAIGISGRDSNLIQARKKYIIDDQEKIDIGWVGEIVSINSKVIFDLLDSGYVPVISPVGCDLEGNVYNINADTAASFISSSINADKLIFLSDVEGLYKDINDKSTIISTVTVDEIKEYIKSGIISGGMIPKMEGFIEAVEKGTKSVHLIDGRKEHILLHALCPELSDGKPRGTELIG